MTSPCGPRDLNRTARCRADAPAGWYSIVVEEAEIQSPPANRGAGDEGLIWRGTFSVPNLLRPTLGETICLLLDDDHKVSAVVTEVDGPLVHFQAAGLMPKPTAQLPERG